MAEDYIRAGFLCDLLEPWVSIEGSEWGGQVTAMHELASRCLGMDDDRAVIVTGWMMAEIGRAFEEEWWGDLDEYLPEIVKARDEYPKTIERWRERARGFNLPPSQNVPDGVDASGAFEETLASLPDWMKPADPDDRRRAILMELEDKKYRLEMDLAAINRQIEEVRLIDGCPSQENGWMDLKEIKLFLRYPYRADREEIDRDLASLIQPGWRWEVSIEVMEQTSFGTGSVYKTDVDAYIWPVHESA